MSQITIYLENELLEQIKQAAESQGLSHSKWIATVLKERLSSSWPEYIKDLAGSWPDDFPEAEALKNLAQDLPRERL